MVQGLRVGFSRHGLGFLAAFCTSSVLTGSLRFSVGFYRITEAPTKVGEITAQNPSQQKHCSTYFGSLGTCFLG